MADKQDPAVVAPDDTEDTEIADLNRAVAFDEGAYRAILKEQGVADAIIDALIAPIKAQSAVNSRLLQRDQARGMGEYKSKLQSEFPLADLDLVSGTTKRELRASAEKLQKFGERVLAAAGKPAEGQGAEGAPAGSAERAEAWGRAPAGPTEVLQDGARVDFDKLKDKAAGALKPGQKAEVLAVLKEQGFRPITRPSFAGVMAGQGQPKPS